MVARATQTLNAFNLDLFGLEVLDVTLNGRPAPQPVGRGADGDAAGQHRRPIPVSPARSAIAARQRSDAGIPRIPLGWQKQITGTFVASEPSGAMNWYPVNNHPRDKASYTFRITVPGPYQVAANGVLASTASMRRMGRAPDLADGPADGQLPGDGAHRFV